MRCFHANWLLLNHTRARALANTCTGVRPPHHCAVALDRSVAWRATQHNLSRHDAPPVASKAVQSLMAAAAKPRHPLRLPRRCP
jgi:hypothetical protein